MYINFFFRKVLRILTRYLFETITIAVQILRWVRHKNRPGDRKNQYFENFDIGCTTRFQTKTFLSLIKIHIFSGSDFSSGDKKTKNTNIDERQKHPTAIRKARRI